MSQICADVRDQPDWTALQAQSRHLQAFGSVRLQRWPYLTRFFLPITIKELVASLPRERETMEGKSTSRIRGMAQSQHPQMQRGNQCSARWSDRSICLLRVP